MPTERDEALQAKGRYGKLNQVLGPGGDRGPFWYGKVVEVHSSGDYLKLCIGTRLRHRWYHRRNVHLHPINDTTGQPAAHQAGTSENTLSTEPAATLTAAQSLIPEGIHEERHGGADPLVLGVFHIPGLKPGRDYMAEFDHIELMGGAPASQRLTFQHGNPAEVGVNGWTNEALLAVLIHRTVTLNDQFPCAENVAAIVKMREALECFNARTAARQARGVEGKLEA